MIIKWNCDSLKLYLKSSYLIGSVGQPVTPKVHLGYYKMGNIINNKIQSPHSNMPEAQEKNNLS